MRVFPLSLTSFLDICFYEFFVLVFLRYVQPLFIKCPIVCCVRQCILVLLRSVCGNCWYGDLFHFLMFRGTDLFVDSPYCYKVFFHFRVAVSACPLYSFISFNLTDLHGSHFVMLQRIGTNYPRNSTALPYLIWVLSSSLLKPFYKSLKNVNYNIITRWVTCALMHVWKSGQLVGVVCLLPS